MPKHALRRLAPLMALLTAGPIAGQSQPSRLPPDTIPLGDLSAFQAPGSNWRIAGVVAADRAGAPRLRLQPGAGVLANIAPSPRGDDLVTAWEHGDIDLSVDFLVPRGSNSGIYLQGRYEIQLFDSWGRDPVTFADAGGIYQRWDPARGAGRQGYEGVAPRLNASRAPGLWQTLEIRFRAPRFDAAGRKVENARFTRVVLNGSLIHENVEVTGPTRSAAFEDEKPTGPLLIQGDHGPVAFRNLLVRRYGGRRVELTGLRFRGYEGEFTDPRQLEAATPARQGAAEALSASLAEVNDRFGLAFDGTLRLPAAGPYRFEMELPWIDGDPHFTGRNIGGAVLRVAGREVLVHPGGQARASAQVELPAGEHPFSLLLYKNRNTPRPTFSLWVEGREVEQSALHAGSGPTAGPAAITVEPAGEPSLLRSFVRHGESKRTHAISVGDPSGVHYALDLATGAPLFAWRGPFVETTPMWHSRGNDQIAIPAGSRLTLSGAPSLARLASGDAPWPDSAAAGFRLLGYALDADGRPTFRYRVEGVEVEDRWVPVPERGTLRRELRIRANATPEGLHLRAGEGKTIERLRDGSYAVDDRTYYLAPARGLDPVVRRAANGEELLVPVRFRDGTATLTYEIIW